MDIDIVVVNYKKYDLTRRFLKSFYSNQPSHSYKLTLFDNESDLNEAYRIQSQFPNMSIQTSLENLGYGRACNLGVQYGNAKYIGIFNNDIEFVNNTCIDQCIDFMEEHKDVGVVGPFQYSNAQGGRKVTNAGILGPGNKPKHRGWLEVDRNQYRFNEEVLMVMGSALIVRRDYWHKITNDRIYKEHFPNAKGGMAETPLYYEDTTLCYAAPHFGYKVFYLGEPGCEVIHQWHQTIKDNPSNEHFARSKQMFVNLMTEWGIEHD